MSSTTHQPPQQTTPGKETDQDQKQQKAAPINKQIPLKPLIKRKQQNKWS